MYMTYGNALVRVASGKGGKSNEKCMGSNPHLRPLQWRAEGGAGGGWCDDPRHPAWGI